jgi:hypothetical protein
MQTSGVPVISPNRMYLACREVWVAVRGEDYIQVLDGTTYQPMRRIQVSNPAHSHWSWLQLLLLLLHCWQHSEGRVCTA